MSVGLGFIVIGVFIYIRESYNIDIVDEKKVFSKKEGIEKDKTYKYKILVCIFSMLFGVFRIINTILY